MKICSEYEFDGKFIEHLAYDYYYVRLVFRFLLSYAETFFEDVH